MLNPSAQTHDLPQTLLGNRVLVVEDDPDINQLICLNLRVLGLEVESCENGLIASERLDQGVFHLVILDVMLPGLDGLSLCKQRRLARDFTPILMLTAKSTEADRVMGLEWGADDYLTKPFSVMELQARAKALLRRIQFNRESSISPGAALPGNASSLPGNACIQRGALSIDPDRRSVHLDSNPLTLTAKEFDLLLFLASAPGRVFDRNTLLDQVWGYNHSGYEHTVNSHINRLRAKLERDPANPVYVLTVWGVGYKFQG